MRRPAAIVLLLFGLTTLPMLPNGSLRAAAPTPAINLGSDSSQVRQNLRNRVANSGLHSGENGEIGFEVRKYDGDIIQAVNPMLTYSSYLGGDVGVAIAVDSAGNTYVTGSARPGFPTTSGAFRTEGGGVIVMKINAEGTTVTYSTFLGSGVGRAIAVDSLGNAYVTGHASSADFPTTAGAFKTDFDASSPANGFVAKLNPTGSELVYSTYLGAGSSGAGIAVDSLGNAYVTGETHSKTFPVTTGAVQSNHGGGFSDAFVAKLNPTGSALVYSTYLGGNDYDSGNSIAVDSAGNAYVTGQVRSSNFPVTPGAFQTTKAIGICYTDTDGTPFPCPDVFVTKLNADGGMLAYSTYLGGAKSERLGGIAVDAAGNAYVAGTTSSDDFPTTLRAYQRTSKGGEDVFVTKLNAAGSALDYSTYLGGDDLDVGYAVAVDVAGRAYVTGTTGSENFPRTPDSIQGLNDSIDVFVAKLNDKGSALVYSTYLGGEFADIGRGIALDSAGSVYVTGSTLSGRFPTTLNAFRVAKSSDTEGFIAKIQLGPKISTVSVAGKRLLVAGDNFDDGAAVVVDGEEQRTRNDDANPRTTLIAKGAGKKVAPGQSVIIRVKNPDGMLSLEFRFTRAVE